MSNQGKTIKPIPVPVPKPGGGIRTGNPTGPITPPPPKK